MNGAAQALVGVHDFRPLSTGFPQDRSAVREVFRWGVTAEEDAVVVECEATGFLRHMIRRANAILVEVGKGRWPETAIEQALLVTGETGAAAGIPTGAGALLNEGQVSEQTIRTTWNKVNNTDETD